MATPDLDVLVVGAGISGISAAHYLQKDCPTKKFAILERRPQLGGTWDLFRYPGIRSDSDMYTLGFRFKPWKEQKAIADGPSILKYLNETVEEYGIKDKIEYNQKVVRADWSTKDALWTAEVLNEGTGETRLVNTRFLFLCSGYYNYDAGYTPEFEGADSFKGQIIHPQLWPEDLDYAGKKVVVIGSGATAVTIVPVMAETAEHVTMLQRSPTYMGSRPSEDALANFLRKILPSKMAYGLIRWRNIIMQKIMFDMARGRPEKVKDELLKRVKDELPEGYDIDTHFTPRYNPWDERLCLVPDSDMFKSISDGSASVVTDHIDHFTETGIRLKSGKELEADIIITATGLALQMAGGADLYVDGELVKTNEHISYKGMMFSDVPNMAFTFGYTNASWTLKADLTSKQVCRMLNHMDANNIIQMTPRPGSGVFAQDEFTDFTSGYFQRAKAIMPKQGNKEPWRQNMNYVRDRFEISLGKIDDGYMEMRKAEDAPTPEASAVPVAAE